MVKQRGDRESSSEGRCGTGWHLGSPSHDDSAAPIEGTGKMQGSGDMRGVSPGEFQTEAETRISRSRSTQWKRNTRFGLPCTLGQTGMVARKSTTETQGGRDLGTHFLTDKDQSNFGIPATTEEPAGIPGGPGESCLVVITATQNDTETQDTMPQTRGVVGT